MSKEWIAIVNRVEARIFDAQNMRKLHTMINRLGREKNKAFTTGKPGMGRSRFSSANGIHAMSGEKKPHDDAAIQFSRRVNQYLYKMWCGQKFEKIMISAEPKMLGWLKKGMDKGVGRHCQWKDKDLLKVNESTLKEHLV